MADYQLFALAGSSFSARARARMKDLLKAGLGDREVVRMLDAARPGRLAVGRLAEDLGDAEAELLVDHDDLAPRDRSAVDEKVDGLAGHAVERDDQALAELERLADGHPRPPDLDRQVDRDSAQPVQVAGAARRRSGVGAVGRRRRRRTELFEFEIFTHHCTATSGNKTSSSLMSVVCLIWARISSLTFVRPLSLVSMLPGSLVTTLVTMSRTTASSGRLP